MIQAAGAVLWRDGEPGPEVALIHRPKYDDWSFPKGKLDKGEHVLRAVVREVVEETGVTPRLGRPLTPQSYVTEGRLKHVDYWAATPREGGNGFVPGDEVDRLDWLPLDEAERRLSHDRDVALLREFATGPLHTTAVIILRHATAGSKHDWTDLDALRPLDHSGRAVARELAELLGAYAPVRPISSATARCVETLLPYALRERISVTTEQAFTMGDDATVGTPPTLGRGELEGARARIAEIAAEAVPTVVCTHGEMAPDLLDEVRARFGGPAARPPAPPKGGFWVLHLETAEPGAVIGLAAVEGHTPGG
ncbi:MAG: hydrolase [Streptosporangiaceae bacterium]|nr:hydrolase [Streptosporangiaceae bacterium]